MSLFKRSILGFISLCFLSSSCSEAGESMSVVPETRLSQQGSSHKPLSKANFFIGAITVGSCDLVNVYLDADHALVNATFGSTKLTALHVAALNKQYAIVRLLVERGANVNAVDAHGNTALFAAVMNGDEEMAVFLLGRGAHAAVQRNSDHATPLHMAAARGSTALVQMLLAQKVLVDACMNVDKKDSCSGRTALHWAVVGDHYEVAKMLLAAGADVHACAALDESQPIHFAAFYHNTALVELLLAHGAQVQPRFSGDPTPLVYARRREGSEGVVALLEAAKAKRSAALSDEGKRVRVRQLTLPELLGRSAASAAVSPQL